MKINQYDIIIVNIDPTVGSEIKKTRPCLVISPNEANHNLNTIIIAPITNTSKRYPTRIEINKLKVKGAIALDQIRTVDKIRAVKKIEELVEQEIIKVKLVLKEFLID